MSDSIFYFLGDPLDPAEVAWVDQQLAGLAGAPPPSERALQCYWRLQGRFLSIRECVEHMESLLEGSSDERDD